MTQEQEQGEPGTAVEPRPEIAEQGAGVAVQVAPTLRQELISDDEMRRMYRLGEALYMSGMFKDIKKAEAAFAKMVIGRDLGMTPMQSMQGLHLVEGGVTVHYAMLGHFIRAREGYDFRTGWLKEEPQIVIEGEAPGAPQVVTVWMDEEDPADLRPILGAVVVYTVNGERRGVSRFTVDDAKAANLIKDGLDKRAAWNTARRNMLLARAMSNGVKWFVPEVLGGLPVYVEGELTERASVTEPAGGGGDEGQGVDLGPKVDAIIERATQLGHAGLSNRGALELALGNRSPAVISKWVRDAERELANFEREQQEAEAAKVEEQADDAVADAVVEGEAEEGAQPDPAPEPAEEPGAEDPAKGLADPIPGPPNPPQADDDRPVA